MLRILSGVLLLSLALNVWAQPILHERFESGQPGQLLPAPWIHNEKDGETKGAAVAEEALSFGAFGGSGRAAHFPEHRVLSGRLFSAMPLYADYDQTFYMSALIKPEVNPEGGWGSEPVCIGVTYAEHKYMEGVWFGIVQDPKTYIGKKGTDFFAISTGGRPSRGLGSTEVGTFMELGQVENGATYFCVAKFIFEGGKDENMIKGYLNIYREGDHIPSDEPAKWHFQKEDSPRKHPYTGKTGKLNLLFISRANTSETATFDEIRLGKKWNDVADLQNLKPTVKATPAPTATPKATASPKPEPQIASKEFRKRAVEFNGVTIKMDEINSGYFIEE